MRSPITPCCSSNKATCSRAAISTPSRWRLPRTRWRSPSAEIGNLSERRMAVLVDPKMSGLPPFLVENSGLNSGFMIAQVTAAALVSENKAMAAPCSVDSIPTSANQEDHVSMATHAARRLGPMVENAAGVVGHRIARGRAGHRLSSPGALVGHAGDRFMPTSAARSRFYAAGPLFRTGHRSGQALGKNRPFLAPGANEFCPSTSLKAMKSVGASARVSSPACMLSWLPRPALATSISPP